MNYGVVCIRNSVPDYGPYIRTKNGFESWVKPNGEDTIQKANVNWENYSINDLYKKCYQWGFSATTIHIVVEMEDYEMIPV